MEVTKRWADRVTAKIVQGERPNLEPIGQDMPYFRFITPVKFTSDFTDLNGVKSATATKLRFNSEEKKYEEFSDGTDHSITVYWFLGGDVPFSSGDMAYVIKRRFWEVIGGGGGGIESLAKFGQTLQTFNAGTIGDVRINHLMIGGYETVKALLPPNYSQVAIANNTPCIVVPTSYTSGGVTANWMIISILYSSDTTTP